MQIIEPSVLGLRSARIVMESVRSPHAVTLFPMIHVADPAFYAQVEEDAMGHDVVLTEGVRHPFTRRTHGFYAEVARQLDLVVQQRFPQPRGAHPRIVHADLSAEEFAELWHEVPLKTKALAAAFLSWPVRLVYVGHVLRGRREELVKRLKNTEMASSGEPQRRSPKNASWSQAIRDARDQRLLACFEDVLREPEPRRIAVVWGALHMRAVLRRLVRDHRFHVADTRWMTVFTC